MNLSRKKLKEMIKESLEQITGGPESTYARVRAAGKRMNVGDADREIADVVGDENAPLMRATREVAVKLASVGVTAEMFDVSYANLIRGHLTKFEQGEGAAATEEPADIV